MGVHPKDPSLTESAIALFLNKVTLRTSVYDILEDSLTHDNKLPLTVSKTEVYG